jgi:hypothetical protein
MTCSWVKQFRETIKDIDHFVTTFAATNIDDDVSVRPLSELLLGDGFACAKGSGDGC